MAWSIYLEIMLNTFNIILTNVNRLNNVRTKVLYNILYHFDNVFDSLPHPEHHHPHHVPVPEPHLAAPLTPGLVKLAGGREELDPGQLLIEQGLYVLGGAGHLLYEPVVRTEQGDSLLTNLTRK